MIMPLLSRKLLIFAATEGLILQSSSPRNNGTVCIDYKTLQIRQLAPVALSSQQVLECHGIVGILRFHPSAYLITISGAQVVAQLHNTPVYVITKVSIIPLSSQVDASQSICNARASQTTNSDGGDDEASDISEDDVAERSVRLDVSSDSNVQSSGLPLAHAEVNATNESTVARNINNIAHDVIGRRGLYGRFAQSWFSEKGWKTERRRTQGMSNVAFGVKSLDASHTSPAIPPETGPTQSEASSQVSQSDQYEHSEHINAHKLLPKLLRTTQMLLSSKSFFFSYDMDITRNLAHRQQSSAEIPLSKLVEPQYFWNHELLKPLNVACASSFALPIMQGFVGQRRFSFDKSHKSTTISCNEETKRSDFDPISSESPSEASTDNFLLTLISRRSILRPGLRYLRRGIDDQGNCANTVETEQILTDLSNGKEYSFTQIRGSIPLFFSQSPYMFKPIPTQHYSDQSNETAMQRHLKNLCTQYGRVQIVSLVDKHGGELAIGKKYEDFVRHLTNSNMISKDLVSFNWFDFHAACRGMKFENVSSLVSEIGQQIESFGQTIAKGHIIDSRQSGVPRVNCMDCLDRTNVVQSALGQKVLETSLRRLGITTDFESDDSIRWFNSLWADNGDAISKQYSSTSALKGDYTRTRQRNYRGALNDLGLTLSRYYHNVFNDFFSQAAIDYILGVGDLSIFEDFQANLMNRDPSISLQRVRANAVNKCMNTIIEDPEEDFLGGWTLLSPRDKGTIRTAYLEEGVLLLTNVALYHASFDWNDEKVVSFRRLNLDHINGINKGTYITSTLSAGGCNIARNVGFLVLYKVSPASIERINTRSVMCHLASNEPHSNINQDQALMQQEQSQVDEVEQFLAFKIPQAHSTTSTTDPHTKHGPAEGLLLAQICQDIQKAIDNKSGGQKNLLGITKSCDIVSLEDAMKSTGLVEQWGLSLKRAIWG